MGEEVYHVTGEVEVEGGASFLHCSVNGMKSRPKLVILDNTVHLFSTVCPSHHCPGVDAQNEKSLDLWRFFFFFFSF